MKLINSPRSNKLPNKPPSSTYKSKRYPTPESSCSAPSRTPKVSSKCSPILIVASSCNTCWQLFEPSPRDYWKTFRFEAGTASLGWVWADSRRSWTPPLGNPALLDTSLGTRTDWGFWRCSMCFLGSRSRWVSRMLSDLETKEII